MTPEEIERELRAAEETLMRSPEGMASLDVAAEIEDPITRLAFYGEVLDTLGALEPHKDRYRQPLVDPETFLDHPDYMGEVLQLWPGVRRSVVDCLTGGYTEAVWTGSLGSGKTTGAIAVLLYLLYEMMNLRDPHGELGMDPNSEISFAFQSVQGKAAYTTGYMRFRAALESSPWFRDHAPFDRTAKSVIRFHHHRVIVEPLSGESTGAIGENIYAFLLDECLGRGSGVDIPGGRVSIERVRPGDTVLAWCERTRSVVEDEVVAARFTGIKSVVEVRFEDGRRVRATPNHPFLTVRGWVLAGDLKATDEVVDASPEGPGEARAVEGAKERRDEGRSQVGGAPREDTSGVDGREEGAAKRRPEGRSQVGRGSRGDARVVDGREEAGASGAQQEADGGPRYAREGSEIGARVQFDAGGPRVEVSDQRRDRALPLVQAPGPGFEREGAGPHACQVEVGGGGAGVSDGSRGRAEHRIRAGGGPLRDAGWGEVHGPGLRDYDFDGARHCGGKARAEPIRGAGEAEDERRAGGCRDARGGLRASHGARVEAVRRLPPEAVWNLETRHTHTFLSDGLVVHNCNHMKVTGQSSRAADGGTHDQAWENYRALAYRRRSRFTRDGKVRGMICLCGSANYPGQFTDVKRDEAREQLAREGRTDIFVSDKRAWEVQPEGRFGKERFRVFTGDGVSRPRVLEDGEAAPEDRVVEVPVEYRSAFESDVQGALKDVAGIATSAEGLFIPDAEAIARAFGSAGSCFLTDWCDFNTAPVRLSKRPPDDPSEPRYVHIDLSLSLDNAALAMGYLRDFAAVDRGGGVVETLPSVRFDGLLSIRPPGGGQQVPFQKVKAVIKALLDLGYPIKYVSLDGFQSADMIQTMRAWKMRSGVVSLDRKPGPYNVTRQALLDGRVSGSSVELVRTELPELRWIPAKQKVDHPPGGSKDLADCVAGVIHGLSTRRELWARHGVSVRQMPESLRQAVNPAREDGSV